MLARPSRCVVLVVFCGVCHLGIAVCRGLLGRGERRRTGSRGRGGTALLRLCIRGVGVAGAVLEIRVQLVAVLARAAGYLDGSGCAGWRGFAGC